MDTVSCSSDDDVSRRSVDASFVFDLLVDSVAPCSMFPPRSKRDTNFSDEGGGADKGRDMPFDDESRCSFVYNLDLAFVDL